MAPHFFWISPAVGDACWQWRGWRPFSGNFFGGNGKRFWAAAKRKRKIWNMQRAWMAIKFNVEPVFCFCLLVEVIVTSVYRPVKGTAGANPVVVAGAGAVASDVAGTPAAATHVAGTPAPATHVASTAAAEPVTGITDFEDRFSDVSGGEGLGNLRSNGFLLWCFLFTKCHLWFYMQFRGHHWTFPPQDGSPSKCPNTMVNRQLVRNCWRESAPLAS